MGNDLIELKICFQDASEFLDVSRFDDANVTGVICHKTGPLNSPNWFSQAIELCRDTPFGCEMRSHFWLGIYLSDKRKRIKIFPYEAGIAVIKHGQEEWSNLARFLPDLYAQEMEKK